MRDMHKWKDKVELSLDNRQIFFLFFGLSVVGCFVFALGVMVGRRVEFDPVGEGQASPQGSLALLDEVAAEAPTTYGKALQQPEPLAPTAAADVSADPALDAEPATPGAAKAVADAKLAKLDKPAKADKPGKPAKAGAVMAAGQGDAAAAANGRRFTLQMKAFAKPEDAEVFAAPLRANGHDVRVEAHEIKGRIWHRVRMGEFDTWEEGLEAKTNFEKGERTIAYVVRL
ncbi:MAG TPA: SPOR domain-containing protein [Nannocystaceae bacterium]|nr:SPOR domain-containing protein [Nannocystaceae bacterium]